MSEKTGKLSGRSAIVTGAAGGIGRATALCLASHGAAVVVADLNRDGADATVSEIRDAGGRAIAVVTDVGREASIIEMVEQTVARFGGVDILHNNAAVLGRESLGRDTDVGAMDLDIWNRTLTINVTGPMLASKHTIPHMVRAGRGSIINTSSGAAFGGNLRLTAYGTSKGALNTLTTYIATQYGKQGIRCNAIAPGLVVTEALVKNPALYDARLQQHLTPRLGAPEDIADAVAFLASDESSFITGQVLCVDGGYRAHSPWVGMPPLR